MSAIPQIVEWANKELPPWQGDAVRRLLTSDKLTDEDRKELLLMAKSAFSLPLDNAAPTPRQPVLGEVPGGPAESKPVVIQAIEDLRGVNLITDGSRLPVAHAGLTIIYGQNGAGKSGFARVLKRACRARDKEERILSNVFADGKGVIPSATIRLTIDGKPDQLIDWKEGGAPVLILGNVSVFDARCARIIVDETNDLQYLPYGADVFEKLASFVTSVKETFFAEKPTPPVVIDTAIGPNTDAGSWLAALAGNTGDAELEKATTWDQQREQSFVESRKQLALLEAGDATKEIERLKLLSQRLQLLGAKAGVVANGLGGGVDEKLTLAIHEVVEKQKASDILAAEASKGEPLPGVGTAAAWKTLYQAAREFSIGVVYPGKPFPNIDDGARCVLCLQPIGAEAQERFTRFQKFMESTIARELAASKFKLVEIRREIVECDVPSAEVYGTIVEDAKHFDSNLAADVPAYFSSYAARKAQQLTKIDDLSANLVASGAQEISDLLTVVSLIVLDQADTLKQASKPDEIEKLRQSVAQEAAWRALAQRKADIRARRDGLRLEAKYAAAYTELRPTAITVKGRDIVTAALTPALIASLNEELKTLNWDTNPIQIKAEGREGTTRVQFQLGNAKAIGDAHLTDVLSEGEQRALAIAGFLAEVKAAGHRQPIVFDDPVSSLDHIFTQRVAARLVREALERQVIVFTHNLALLVELNEAAETLALRGSLVPVEVITVSRMERPGVAVPGHPWEGAKTKERANQLVGDLANFKDLLAGDKTEYNRRAAYLYSRLREAWESLVERDLLGAVIARYRLSVQTQTLWGITIEDKDVFQIEAAMSKASRFMVGHDTSLHISEDRPRPAEVAEDIEELRAFADMLTKRREKVRDARKKALKLESVKVG